MLRRVKPEVLIDAAPIDPSVRAWHEPLARSVEQLSDDTLAAEFGGWVISQARGKERLTDDSSSAAEGVHQTTRLLLGLAEAVAAEGERPVSDIQGIYAAEYLGRLIGQIAEVVGPDFVKVHIDG